MAATSSWESTDHKEAHIISALADETLAARDGAPLAIINNGYIQHMRVAATSAIAARTHALAFASIRGLKEIRVYSPNVDHLDQFAQEIGSKL